MLMIDGLSKRYPKARRASLDGLTLSIRRGVFGLLGPNGAGKSTLLEILGLRLRPTAGSARLEGVVSLRDGAAWLGALGYLPQQIDFPPGTTARDLLLEAAVGSGVVGAEARRRADALLERTNLREHAGALGARYSRGMKQRLALAMVLIHRPKLVLLDEPTAGLDPKERAVLRELLIEEARDRLIILSTHIAADLERSCDRLAVLREGRLVFEGTPLELTARGAGRVSEAQVGREQWEAFRQGKRISWVQDEGPTLRVRFLAPGALPPTMEEGYLALMAENPDEK